MKNRKKTKKVKRLPEYTIQDGDNLSVIARRYGLTWRELYQLTDAQGQSNSERLRSGDPDLIYPGEVIWVPGDAETGEDEPGGEVETEPDWDEEEPGESIETAEVPEMESIEEPGSGGQAVGSDGGAVTLRTVSRESEDQEEPPRISVVDVTTRENPTAHSEESDDPPTARYRRVLPLDNLFLSAATDSRGGAIEYGSGGWYETLARDAVDYFINSGIIDVPRSNLLGLTAVLITSWEGGDRILKAYRINRRGNPEHVRDFHLTEAIIGRIGTYFLRPGGSSAGSGIFYSVYETREGRYGLRSESRASHLVEVMAEGEEDAYLELNADYPCQLLYLTPLSENHWWTYAIFGGTRTLEPYNDGERRRIHSRNQRALQSYSLVHNAYIANYVRFVRDEETDIEDLSNRGQPFDPNPRTFFPIDDSLNATQEEQDALLVAKTYSAFEAYLWVGRKVSRLVYRRHSAGDIFFRVKFKDETGFGFRTVESQTTMDFDINNRMQEGALIEHNQTVTNHTEGFDIGRGNLRCTIRRYTDENAEPPATHFQFRVPIPMRNRSGVTGGEDRTSVENLNIDIGSDGTFDVSIPRVGGTSLERGGTLSVTGPSVPIPGVSVQPHAEGNMARGEFFWGVKVTLPGGTNIFLLMGFQGLSSENEDALMQRIFSNAPGFFSYGLDRELERLLPGGE